MEIQRCRKESIFHIGFIDPYVVNDKTVREYGKETENNIFNALMGQHYKTYILLPYNFEYVFSYWLILILFQALMLRLIIYIYRFHWVLLAIELDKSKIVVYDSQRRPREDYQLIIDMLNR